MKKMFLLIIIFISSIFGGSKLINAKEIFLLDFINSYNSDTTKMENVFLSDSLLSIKDSTKTVKQNRVIEQDTNSCKSSKLLCNFFVSSVFRKEVLNYADYRYAGNFFSYMPFGFLRDLGSIGQPNEVLLYGQGYNNSTYFFDGININNRLFNSFDLNLFQSESIYSIEIIPFARGFLYGLSNNSVSVNFVPKEFNTTKPYTRIRFYQAPNEEGMVDGIFSSNFGKRLSIFSEVTHQSTDSRYRNSDYGIWQGNLRARYILSENLSIAGSYQYSKSNVQLNGGVNADSIKEAYSLTQFEDVLYNNILAPVKFYNRYQKATSQNLNLRLLANLIPSLSNDNQVSTTDFSFYYQTSLIEFRQNDTTNKNFQSNVDKIFHNNEYKTYGLRLRQDFGFSFFNLSSVNELEHTKFFTPLLFADKQLTAYSSSLILTSILPYGLGNVSLFGKYLNWDNISYTGIGGDVVLNLYAERQGMSNSLKFYFGVSTSQKPRNVLEQEFLLTNDKQKSNIAEAKISFTNRFIKTELGYFYSASTNKYIAAIIDKDSSITEESIYFTAKKFILNGLNFNINFKLWKVLMISNTSIYFSNEARKENGLPEFTSNGGIYYVDTLFNSNLNLKSGFNYWLFGKRNYLSIDFEKNISTPYHWYFSPIARTIPYIPEDEYSPSFQLDFFVAGQIQERAIVYFVFENLLDTKYFIVPYFPKQERGIRLGVAWEFFD